MRLVHSLGMWLLPSSFLEWVDDSVGSAGSGRALFAATIVAVILFVGAGVLRVAPANHHDPRIAKLTGEVARSVENVHRIARERAEKPFFEVKDHLIFFGRNPGMFHFVAETAVRAGM